MGSHGQHGSALLLNAAHSVHGGSSTWFTMFGISGLLALALATFTIASPVLLDRRSFEVKNGVNYTVFEHAATGAKLSFVTNSGVCETTPGVNQYSGYFSVGTNMVRNSSL
jgi:hypothetical protein